MDLKGKGRAVEVDDAPDDIADSHATTSEQPYLVGLNKAQREAVTWSRKGGLQILAGPGSGKTRVLTCRVAHLVRVCHIQPQDLIVVTFTNKAANEMKHRLKSLLGQEVVNRIMMGTFHSVAVRYLRKYGKGIELPNNFIIADSSDSQSLLKPIVAQHYEALKKKAKDAGGTPGDEIKVKVAQDIISKSKSKGISEDQYLAEASNAWKQAMADIYNDYQLALRASNTLDFDDLLVYCEKLLRQVPTSVKNIQHVLVDEFQDTNSMQYEIVRHMAAASGSLTIVGDPDQSIYSWRSAEVENLLHMMKDFKGTHQVMLEENYRSTSSILQAALAVVEQDKERIQKSLKTSHPAGPPVILRKFETTQDEAAYIAYEVKRAIAYSGNTLNFNDFAILLRYNALSRNVEAALQSAGIPSRMIGGHKFFDRAEVKDVLAYLQLADNPSYTPAFRRVVNVPKRGVGDKTVKDIEAAAKQKSISCFEVVNKAVRGNNFASIKPGQKAALKSFCQVVATLRQMATSGKSVEDLIDYLITALSYKDHLERVHGLEHMTKFENINELKSFAEQVAASNAINLSEIAEAETQNASGVPGRVVIDLDADEDNLEISGDTSGSPLRDFLASSMLSTDTETQDAKDDKSSPKVTISTCHAAKGLEWPVVFLPAAETGVYPAFRKSDSAEVAEERRLFYVAMTRAQAFLHITHCAKRMERGQTEDKEVTEFLASIVRSKAVAFAATSIAYDETVRACLAAVTRRQLLDEDSVKTIVDVFHETAVAPVYSQPDFSRARYQVLTDQDIQFTKQGIHLFPSKPMYPGEAWRMNSYAGDQAKRYAAHLPNAGVNRFAGAFATTSSIAASTQAPGFTSALKMSDGVDRKVGKGSITTFSGSFGSFNSAGNVSSRPFTSGTMNKPFKPPTSSRPVNLPTVSTVETRLTAQNHAVILNPITPNEPQAPAYTLPVGKDEDFSFLRGLAKEESDDFAVRRPAQSKRSPNRFASNPPLKRSKS